MALNLNNLPRFWRGTEDELASKKANVENGAIYFLKPAENSKFGRIAFDYDNARIIVGSDDIHVKQTTIANSSSDKYPLVISPVEGEGEVYRTPGAMITPNGNLYIGSIESIDAALPLTIRSNLYLAQDLQMNSGDIQLVNRADIVFVSNDSSELSVKDTINTLTDNGTNIQSINTIVQEGINEALNTDSGVITEQINSSVIEGIDTALTENGVIADYVNNAVVNSINTHNNDVDAHKDILAKKSVIYERNITCPIQSSIEITIENIIGNTFTGNAFNFDKFFEYIDLNEIAIADIIFKYMKFKFEYSGSNWHGYLVDSQDLTGGSLGLGGYQLGDYFIIDDLTDIGFSANEQLGTVTTDSVIYLNLYARELCGIVTFTDLPEVTSTSTQEVLPGLGATLKELTNLQTLQLQDGGQWEGTIRLFAYGYYEEDVSTLPVRIIVRGD